MHSRSSRMRSHNRHRSFACCLDRSTSASRQLFTHTSPLIQSSTIAIIESLDWSRFPCIAVHHHLSRGVERPAVVQQRHSSNLVMAAKKTKRFYGKATQPAARSIQPSNAAKSSRRGAYDDSEYLPTDPTIFFFRDYEQYGYFCQWYLADMHDDRSGMTFNCCEQYMMWHKAKYFDDVSTMERIMATKSPQEQKNLGKQVHGFDEAKWSQVKFDVVVRANTMKFTQCMANREDKFVYSNNGQRDEPEVPLKDLLLATGTRRLAEASRFDRVWGIGFGAEKAVTVSRRAWGQNLLGKALMHVRRNIAV